jgi:hypothetical protein
VNSIVKCSDSGIISCKSSMELNIEFIFLIYCEKQVICKDDGIDYAGEPDPNSALFGYFMIKLFSFRLITKLLAILSYVLCIYPPTTSQLFIDDFSKIIFHY